jgi:fumarate reductase flavoprotein subunit
MSVRPSSSARFTGEVPILVVGGGAAGLCAALAAHEAGVACAVLERDPVPRGSTALSAGLIPAAGTRFQRERGIADEARSFAADILRKAKNEPDPAIVELVARQSAPLIEWLADAYGFDFSVVHDFDYPGHSARRMHGLPTRSGVELVDRLRKAVEDAEIPILTRARVTTIFADATRRVVGIETARPDGAGEQLACWALVLACNGFGANRGLVARHIPEMADALYFGHPGNLGDAIKWGEALGARFAAMSGYQGHGSVAHPHGILITWATMSEGGFQVDRSGRRFANESTGYSEQAHAVLRLAGETAFSVFDERIAAIARQFEDFRQAEAQGAVIEARTAEELARQALIPEDAFAETFASVDGMKRGREPDPLRRDFRGLPTLAAPFKCVKVTGALFHTQGGLVVDREARVVGADGTALPNLFAAGGAAVGVSGSTAAGYLSGNGLLTATVLGRLAGRSAARLVERERRGS